MEVQKLVKNFFWITKFAVLCKGRLVHQNRNLCPDCSNVVICMGFVNQGRGGCVMGVDGCGWVWVGGIFVKQGGGGG